MASPTLAEIQAQGRNAVDIIEDLRAHFDSTQLTQLDTLNQSLEGDFTPDALSSWATTVRGQMSAMLSPSILQAFWIPVLREHGKFINVPERLDVSTLLRRIYDWMDDNSEAVETRNITYATPSAGGGNTGNGSLKRCTKDERNYDIESCHVEAKTLECVFDANSGTRKHAEVFEMRGVESSIDLLGLAGSGERFKGQIISKHSGSGAGGSLLPNSSFDAYNSGGTTDKFAGWTMDAAGLCDQDTTNFYRTAPGASTSGSLRFLQNGTINVILRSRNIRLSKEIPYGLRVMFNRQVGGADGTLTIALGSQTTNVAMAAQTGWNELMIPLDTNSYFDNFNEDDLDVAITLSGGATFGLLIDDVILAPLPKVDGTFWWLTGGDTAWLVDDVFTMTDSGGAAGTGKLNYWLWRAGLGYLPHASGGSITWTDP